MRRRRRTAWESVEASAHFGPTAQRWTRSYRQLSGIEEFPSVSETEEDVQEEQLDESESEGGEESKCEEFPDQSVRGDGADWRSVVFCRIRKCYTAFERFIWRPFEFATTFIRRLTIPLVDQETWDKNFAVASPPFIIFMVGISVFQLSLSNPFFIGVIVLGGGCLSVAVEHTTSHEQPPEGVRLAPFVCVAFVMSVIWIMNIADEVLSLVLHSLGGRVHGLTAHAVCLANRFWEFCKHLAVSLGSPTLSSVCRYVHARMCSL